MKRNLTILLFVAFFLGSYLIQNLYANGGVSTPLSSFNFTTWQDEFYIIRLLKPFLLLLRNVTRGHRQDRIGDMIRAQINAIESAKILNVIKEIRNNIPLRYLPLTLILVLFTLGSKRLRILNNLNTNFMTR